jgi:hypothetical protein
MRVTNRFAAFAIHLGISLLMFLVLAAIIKFIWYPGVLFDTEGGWEGIKLIAGVDLVIGPTLTLMVYNIAKKELKRDLAVIGLLQLACVVAGMVIVGNSRPIAVVYADDIFYTITKARYEASNISTDTIPLLKNPKPVFLNVDLPPDSAEKARVVVQWGFMGGIDIATKLYQPYENALKLLPTEGSSLNEAVLKKYQIPVELTNNDHVRLFELHTRYGNYPVLVNTQTGEIVQTVSKRKT